MKHVPRFYCPSAVAADDLALTTDQQHHLLAVLRRAVGDELLLFNEQVGEWRAVIAAVNKKTATIKIMGKEKTPPAPVAKTILFFALLEKSRLDMLIPKSVELGVSDLAPVISEFTDRRADEWQRQKEKWQKVVVASAEQSGRLTMPHLHDATNLSAVVKTAQDIAKTPCPIIYADEKGGDGFYQTMASLAAKNIALVVGPPGGFSDGERAMLRQQENVHAVHLGQTILRSETAAMAMLAGLLFSRKL
ncbi:MAG: RsmE family RNA methyltransferase [Hydrotalea sp.]|nr:RsmE family RNA methyltransferase [Hydrotalea sp.]